MAALVIPRPDRPHTEIKRLALIRPRLVHVELLRRLPVDGAEWRRDGHEDRGPGRRRATRLPIFVLPAALGSLLLLSTGRHISDVMVGLHLFAILAEIDNFAEDHELARWDGCAFAGAASVEAVVGLVKKEEAALALQ